MLTPKMLERYSFQWTLARLLIAALALLLGGVPPILKIFPYTSVSGLLQIAWLLSGAASVYLLYRWHTGGKKLFGAEEKKDTIAFLIATISGINLGIVGLGGTNIGMSVTSSSFIYFVTAMLYLWSAYHLYHRWNGHAQTIF